MEPAVRARAITKSFGDVVAVDGVDLDVEQGQIHGLVGPNGAGKTTLLGLLLGLAVADNGSLTVLGTELRRSVAVPSGVAGFVDGPGLYPSMTARKNLQALGRLRGDGDGDGEGDGDNAIAAVLDEVGLSDVADDRVRGFSLGMRQRLGLAAALLGKPRLLVLDEPANGLDPAGSRHVHRVLTRLASTGTSIIVSSHQMNELAALCDEITLLVNGRVRFTGTVRKLAAETGDLDYRLRTSDPVTARRIACAIPELRVIATDDSMQREDVETIRVRGSVAALDAVVARIVGAGVAVRELAPVMSPLEAAYLALTGDVDGAGEVPA